MSKFLFLLVAGLTARAEFTFKTGDTVERGDLVKTISVIDTAYSGVQAIELIFENEETRITTRLYFDTFSEKFYSAIGPQNRHDKWHKEFEDPEGYFNGKPRFEGSARFKSWRVQTEKHWIIGLAREDYFTSRFTEIRMIVEKSSNAIVGMGFTMQSTREPGWSGPLQLVIGDNLLRAGQFTTEAVASSQCSRYLAAFPDFIDRVPKRTHPTQEQIVALRMQLAHSNLFYQSRRLTPRK